MIYAYFQARYKCSRDAASLLAFTFQKLLNRLQYCLAYRRTDHLLTIWSPNRIAPANHFRTYGVQHRQRDHCREFNGRHNTCDHLESQIKGHLIIIRAALFVSDHAGHYGRLASFDLINKIVRIGKIQF